MPSVYLEKVARTTESANNQIHTKKSLFLSELAHSVLSYIIPFSLHFFPFSFIFLGERAPVGRFGWRQGPKKSYTEQESKKKLNRSRQGKNRKTSNKNRRRSRTWSLHLFTILINSELRDCSRN